MEKNKTEKKNEFVGNTNSLVFCEQNGIIHGGYAIIKCQIFTITLSRNCKRAPNLIINFKKIPIACLSFSFTHLRKTPK